MKCFGVLVIGVLMCAVPASAAVVDGHVYADFVSYEGASVLYGGAESLADAVALPHDGKYAEIKGPAGSSWFALRMQFPVSALSPTFRVHLADGTTSRYFTVQGFTTSFSAYRYLLEGVTWSSPDYDVGMYFGDAINYVEVRQRQEYAAGVVYIDAIEATNIPPVVSAGLDLTITPDQQATTIIQGAINDSLAYSAGYVWQKNGVSLTGWLPFSPDGSASLNLATLAPLAVGTYTFKLVTKDGGINVTDEMVLTVSSNRAPVAVDDVVPAQINSAATIDVLANDSDPDEGDVLSIASFTQGASGTVALADGGLSYTPGADFFGTDSFTYTVSDVQGAAATATVTVTVNRPPVAAPDAGQTEVDLAITIAVLENDRDDDHDPLTVTSVGQATSGSVTLNTDGTVTYMPAAGFTGQDAFSYTIGDGRGGTSAAEVGIVVNPRFVLIDIKPGSYPNSINLGSNGVVPMAILSTAGFDATTVDPGTVSLAGANVAVRGKGNRLMANNQDVNADGLVDLVLYVETENLDPDDMQDGYGTVIGTTYAGMPIIGTDEITIVPQ